MIKLNKVIDKDFLQMELLRIKKSLYIPIKNSNGYLKTYALYRAIQELQEENNKDILYENETCWYEAKESDSNRLQELYDYYNNYVLTKEHNSEIENLKLSDYLYNQNIDNRIITHIEKIQSVFESMYEPSPIEFLFAVFFIVICLEAYKYEVVLEEPYLSLENIKSKNLEKEKLFVFPQVKISHNRVDFLLSINQKNIIVECDSYQYHSNENQFEHDRNRMNFLGYFCDKYIAITGRQLNVMPVDTIEFYIISAFNSKNQKNFLCRCKNNKYVNSYNVKYNEFYDKENYEQRRKAIDREKQAVDLIALWGAK